MRMRRRTSILVAAWLGGCALIGCNLILGSESALFEPDAGTAGGGAEAGRDGTTDLDSGGSSDTSVDGAPDATPCINVDTNPLHCGSCGHDCLGGKCSGGKCQPVVIVNEPGNAQAIAVDATHVYWTNTAGGDVRRAPIAGGAAETVYDGPPGTPLGKRLVRTGAHVYFTVGTVDGGVYRCPAAGCGATAPEAVVAPLAQPGFVGLSGTNKLLIAESTSNGRVGRCTLPCAGGLDDVIAPTEGFPVYAADQGDDVYWSTILPAGGEVRARPGINGAPVTIKTSAFATEVAVVGQEVLYIQLGKGPVAIPRDGGAIRRLSTTDSQSERLVVDNGIVYFNDAAGSTGGRILSCEVTGCGDAGGVIATNQIRPYALAVDTKSLYWTNNGDSDAGASVMRIAK
jgi:hypothetical protein